MAKLLTPSMLLRYSQCVSARLPFTALTRSASSGTKPSSSQGPGETKKQHSEEGVDQQPGKSSEEATPISKANIPPSDRGPFTWKSLAIGGSLLVGVAAYVEYLREEKLEKVRKEKQRSMGKAAIGGSFELVDGKGNIRRSEEFHGKWVLIYFGFTHCPDVCPEELEKLSSVVKKLKEKGQEIVPIFISVDPERDTPELVDKYLKEFSDDFIGLTGTKEQIAKATRTYRVYYSAGPKDKDNDYIVDHTIISYLISPEGELIDYFGQTRPEDEVFYTIKARMNSYRR